MPTVGRNDPCPCGSGKKYKKCCQPRGEAAVSPEELIELIEAGQVGAEDQETIQAMGKARELEQEGRFHEALGVLEELPHEKKLFPTVALELSFLLRSVDRLEEAEAYLEAVERLIPENPMLFIHKACLLYRQGHGQDAQECLRGMDRSAFGKGVLEKLEALEQHISAEDMGQDCGSPD